mmetsp:Transcript_60094/g.174004  ORF Transcript_60094/g.174004 Transcript_60094/m.174004 type:complete len:212 (+) Transcript_60094:2114-2749(+)
MTVMSPLRIIKSYFREATCVEQSRRWSSSSSRTCGILLSRAAMLPWDRSTQPRDSAASPLKDATSRCASVSRIIWLRSKRSHWILERSSVMVASAMKLLSISVAGCSAAYPEGAALGEAALFPRRAAPPVCAWWMESPKCFCRRAMRAGASFVFCIDMTTRAACSMVMFAMISSFDFSLVPTVMPISTANASLTQVARNGKSNKPARKFAM